MSAFNFRKYVSGIALLIFTFFVIAAPCYSRSIPTISSAGGPSTYGDLLSEEQAQKIQFVIINSPPTPPEGYIRATAESLPQDTVILEVPTSTWTYGCSATAAGMLFGYYDRNGFPDIYTGPTNGGVCPLENLGQGMGSPIPGSCSIIATQGGFDGRSTFGHVDDYWIGYDEPGPDPWEQSRPEHTWGKCTADFMGTNQWKWDFYGTGFKNANYDGATILFYYNDGTKLYDFIPPEHFGLPQTALCHGMRLFAESRGYIVEENYTQVVDTEHPDGFTFEDYMDEIDAGCPVMIQVRGHSMTGVGYHEDSETIYVHDTWDNDVHSMEWGGNYANMEHYAVNVIHLKRIPIPDYIEITGPDSVYENSTTAYNCTAYFYGANDVNVLDSLDVTYQAGWSENAACTNITGNGYLVASEVTSDQISRIKAVYIGVSDTHDVTIMNRPSFIEISGPILVDENSTAQYSCIVHYDDSAPVDVSSETFWNENSAYAEIDPTGFMETSSVPQNQFMLVTAEYMELSCKYYVTIKKEGPTLFVDDNGPDDPAPQDTTVSDPCEDGSELHPFDAIQEAVAAAQNGYTIIIKDGTYTGTGNRDIDSLAKNIDLRSIYGPGTVIIDCESGKMLSEHRAFYLRHNGGGFLLDGVTITNGYHSDGGGIFIEPGANTTILNCVVKKCKAISSGGGISGCGGPIINSSIADNKVLNGTGAGLYLCSGPLIDSRIAGNETDTDGWGLYNCSADINNCTIIFNDGGGLYNCSGSIVNSDISNNIGTGLMDCHGDIEKCTVTYNTAGGLNNCDGDIKNSQISNNTSTGSGAGLYLCDGQIHECNITFNSAEINGGGLSNCSAQITDCNITDNYADEFGGGLHNCSGTISGSLINNNESVAGGGGLHNCNTTISKCTINNNFTIKDGGGLLQCDANVNNCVLAKNRARYGGGVWDCDGMIINCTIADNIAMLYGGGLGCFEGDIKNCIIWDNFGLDYKQIYDCPVPEYSCVQGLYGGIGNIYTDPLFADPDERDYHLKSQTGRYDPVSAQWVKDNKTSPCIDAGHPGFDWTDSEPRPNGYCANMGAYGDTNEASMSFSDGDISFNCAIDTGDLEVLSQYWLGSDESFGMVLNDDGIIDFLDYAILANNWKKLLLPAICEDFEYGDFTEFDWQHSGSLGWRIVYDVFYGGTYAAKSGNITHLQQSILEFDYQLEYELNTISFWRKVSCEEDFDYLRFYINDENNIGGENQQWTGEQDWALKIYELTKLQAYNFKWVYEKDFSGNYGDDSAWIDDIRIYFDPGH